MKFTDEQLRDAAVFLRKAYCASLPDVSNYHPEYSPEFIEKMDRLCRQYQLRQNVKSFSQKIVAAIVVLLITGSLWIGLNVDVRAAFQTWLIEIYENTFIYHFFNDPVTAVTEGLASYDIQKLPEGYIFVKELSTTTEHIKLYRNGENTLTLMYFEKNNQTMLGIVSDDRIETRVGKYSASFYRSTDGDSNDLVWLSEDTDVIFVLSGFLTEKQMVEIAESIVTVP